MLLDARLDEVVRARELQPRVFRALQTHLRDVVDPQLKERLTLLAENEALKIRIADLEATLSAKRTKS